MPTALRKIAIHFLLIALFASVVGLQFAYDRARLQGPPAKFPPVSADLIRTFDLGLHTAVASFIWIQTLIQLPFLQEGYAVFAHNLDLINTLDPKFSFPYAFTTLVLPSASDEELPNKAEEVIRIATKGIAEADPDWRIPFYLGIFYLIDMHDREGATHSFDIAAQTPGVPPNIRSVAVNFGTPRHLRDEIRDIWEAIRDTAEDEVARGRAEDYLLRLDIFELLEQATGQYRNRFGAYPEHISDLVTRGIIPEIPRDPFGFEFAIGEQGEVRVIPPQVTDPNETLRF